jgi:dephospho-CoA kinase
VPIIEKKKEEKKKRKKEAEGRMIRTSRLLSVNVPYTTILGFTGGIASGKSSRCQHLLKLALQKAEQPTVSLGVSYVSADQVGHSMYEPGKPCYTKILDAFGKSEVLSADGMTIDRRKLGSIVFTNKSQMDKLNGILWPHFDEALLTIVEENATTSTLQHGNRNTLIILEAAVLIEQGFVKHCNDVWLTSCSKNEAIRRVMARNGLSAEDAAMRIASQMTIEDRLNFLKTSGFAGSIQHFDTTDVTLEAGLKQVATAFDEYWTTKLRPLCRSVA